MTKIDEIKTVCARLAGMGWQDLLKRHGLDITKGDLAAELSRELAIDRSVPGFEDFTLTGKRGSCLRDAEFFCSALRTS